MTKKNKCPKCKRKKHAGKCKPEDLKPNYKGVLVKLIMRLGIQA